MESGAGGGPPTGGEPEPAARIGEGPLPWDEDAHRTALEAHEIVERPGSDRLPTTWLPLHVGGRTGGVLAARGVLASRAVLEPAARLLALAVERERLLDEAAHLEAVRQSDALKTSLLRRLAHDLRTPLTPPSGSRPRAWSAGSPAATMPPRAGLERLRTLAREQERLARRIDNLLALARVEAGVARPRPEPVLPGDLFRAARESLASILAGREVSLRIEPGCADLWTDPSLTLEVVVNLLENAARAAAGPIELAAGPSRIASGRVRIEVRDRAPDCRRAYAASSPARPSRWAGGPGHGPGRRAGDTAPPAGSACASPAASPKPTAAPSFADRPGGGTIAALDLPAAPEAA